MNDEGRIKSEIQMSKATGDRRLVRISGFGLPLDFVIRISSLSSGMNESSKNQNPNTGMKTPKTKLQTPEKLQIPNSKAACLQQVLGFGAWTFSGAWGLGFGVSISRLSPRAHSLSPV
jgi:hypothetical protein